MDDAIIQVHQEKMARLSLQEEREEQEERNRLVRMSTGLTRHEPKKPLSAAEEKVVESQFDWQTEVVLVAVCRTNSDGVKISQKHQKHEAEKW
jgi:hypothetical protein